MNASELIDIDSHFKLTDQQLNFYRTNEFIKLKNVLSPETITHYKEAIWRKTLELNTNTLPMNERDTYSKAFIQVINLWRYSEKVTEFPESKL